jgi:ribosome-binding factor A
MAGGDRVERLRDEIRRAVSQIVQSKLKDPKVGFVTITDAELSRDLQQVTVYYSVYGSAAERKATNSALQKARGFIQSEMARIVRIRRVPNLTLKIDRSAERGMRIQQLLDQVHKADNDHHEDPD